MGVYFKPYCKKCDFEMTEKEIVVNEEEIVSESINSKGMIHHLNLKPDRINKIVINSETLQRDVDVKFNSKDMTFDNNILILSTAYKDTMVKEVQYIINHTVQKKQFTCESCGYETIK